MIRFNLFLSTLFTLAACGNSSDISPNVKVDPPYGVSVTRNVSYGEGLVTDETGQHLRKLLLDVYSPAGAAAAVEGRPGILLAFGGSFHRGSKGEGGFTDGDVQSSSMADYCRMFAQSGYVCFSMEYRLHTENPVLSSPIADQKLMPESLAVTAATTARIDFARREMGLPPLDASGRTQLWQSILAASEDMGMAVNYVRSYSGTYGLDPERLAIGGFSAGAITAINTAYGANAPVKAVVALSGSSWGYNLAESARADGPPLLMFIGENDLPGIKNGSAQIAALFGELDIKQETAKVPGFGHFYPMEAVSLAQDPSELSVSERMIGFLDTNIRDIP